jgi:hypothetical protein
MKLHHRSATICAICVALSTAALAADADKSDKAKEDAPRNPVPAALHGFEGTLGGKVVSVQDHMHGFVLKIFEIRKIEEHSSASNPKAAVGQEIEVTPSATKNADGVWISDERQTRFITSLKEGQYIHIAVFVPDKIHVRIANLTATETDEAQQERKKEKEKK